MKPTTEHTRKAWEIFEGFKMGMDRGETLGQVIGPVSQALCDYDEAHQEFRNEVLHLITAAIRSVCDAAVISDKPLKLDYLMGWVQRALREAEESKKKLAELEANYGKVVSAVLECDPIPACKREDDQLEPPWEVIDRVRKERDRLLDLLGRALQEDWDPDVAADLSRIGFHVDGSAI